MITKEVKKILSSDFDTISKKSGIFTVRKSYFYTHGGTTQKIVNIVKSKIPSAKIIDSGDHWAAFRGGASVANQSHWYVKFTI